MYRHVTVTTEAARRLYPTAATLRVWVGRLCDTQIDSFLQEQGIVAILEASHPYAVEISKLAIAKATQRQIPYLRYERPSLELPQKDVSVPQAIDLDSFDKQTSDLSMALEFCRQQFSPQP